MIKSAFSILAVTAAAGIALTPVAASAATASPAVLALSSSPSQAGPGLPEDTTVTFTVTSTGTLSITAPTDADLGTGAIGGPAISGPLGTTPTIVADDRALDDASWTAVASSSDWALVGGGGAANETIPAADVSYDPGTITPTGTILPVGTPVLALSTTPQTVVAVTGGVGDNSASWTPTITVAVPSDAVAGGYTGTLTQSVS